MATTKQPANVALVKGAAPVTVDGPVNAGMGEPIKLPSEAEQRRGFYLERAAELIRLYPDKYKPVVAKGGAE